MCIGSTAANLLPYISINPFRFVSHLHIPFIVSFHLTKSGWKWPPSAHLRELQYFLKVRSETVSSMQPPSIPDKCISLLFVFFCLLFIINLILNFIFSSNSSFVCPHHIPIQHLMSQTWFIAQCKTYFPQVFVLCSFNDCLLSVSRLE